ncbi:nitrate- and nitrite sensing domain-containing protein [Streptomyces luteolus]|uniref:nitrate- and nitrite sensing domain-containing protein n=1 Tax=Streptomyces luteolus TaxID=3043615 RepID=UPI0032B72917
MRAPVQMKRPRGKGDKAAERPVNAEGATSEARADTPEGTATGAGTATERPLPDAAPAGGRKRVRNRLVVAVAVVAATVAGAGAPGITASSAQLAESQELVTLAELTKSAVTLAHALADERDKVTTHIAAGRPDDPAARSALTEGRGGVDRRIREVRAEAPAALRKDLDALEAVRRSATEGRGTALDAHDAYSEAIGELHALVEDLAEKMPPRAGSGARALADLDRAVEQAGATRGLLLAALATPRDPAAGIDPVTGRPQTAASTNSRNRNALVAAAQQARVSEQAARTDFERAAPDADRAKLGSTVTGPDVATAERYLARLTDQPTLSAAELRYDRGRVEAALSARVEQLRSVENTLGADRIESLSTLRDDDVTALEVRIALVGVLLLLAVGIATGVARTLTRPLAVLRLGSARLAETPATDEPIRFTGRNDEFAAVVRSVNTLHTHTQRLQERLTFLEGDRKHLVGQREKLADEREELREQLDEAVAAAERAGKDGGGTVVQLALRNLTLVERQLGVIENLEEREQDPDRLGTLFKLDHFATVMRRHSENLLVLAGAEHRDSHPGPVPLVDVVRAAVSEIDAYDRVRIASLPPHTHLAGSTADDISHLVAELLENATSFSPPDAAVEASGWLLESGDVMLSVRDEGIGLPEERLRELNARLTEFDPRQPYEPTTAEVEAAGSEGLGLGLYVVARLAARHGLRVELREQKQGGLAALVVLPTSILAAAPAGASPQHAAAVTAVPRVHLPGAEAEVNSNVLDRRSAEEPGDPDTAEEPVEQEAADDPFIRAAERAFDELAAAAEPGADTEPEADEESEAEASDAVDSERDVERDERDERGSERDEEPELNSDSDREPDLAPEPEQKLAAEPEPEFEHAPEAKPGHAPKAKPGYAPDSEPGHALGPEPELNSDSERGLDLAPEPGQKLAAEPEAELEHAPEAKPEHAADSEPGHALGPEPELESDSDRELDLAPEPGQKLAAEPKPELEHAPEAKPEHAADPDDNVGRTLDLDPASEHAPEAKPEHKLGPEQGHTLPDPDPEHALDSEQGRTPDPEQALDPELKHALDPEPESEPEHALDPEQGRTPDPEQGRTPDPEPEHAFDPEPKHALDPDPEPALDPEPEPEPKHALDPQPVSGRAPEPASEAELAPEPASEAEPAPEPASEAVLDPEPASEAELASAGEPEPDPEAELASAGEPDPEPAPAPRTLADALGVDGLSPEAEADRELLGVEAESADGDPAPLPAPASDSVLASEADERHERAADAETVPQQARREVREALPQRERTTETGLPVRTPKATGPAPEPVARRSAVDPEELRRRLGSFHRGANSGRRDVQAELAERTTRSEAGDDVTPGEVPDRATRTDQGDPAEEARS